MNDLSDIFGGVSFDPYAVEPQGDFPIVPPGKTPALIEKAEVRRTKKETGHYIYLEMQILDGPCKGQKLFDQINIQNPSTVCVEIGLRTLSALARAIGLQTVKSVTQLLNQIVIAHVKVKDEQNSIRTYSAASQAPGAAPVVHVDSSGTPAPAPESVAPLTQPITPPPIGKERGLPWER